MNKLCFMNYCYLLTKLLTLKSIHYVTIITETLHNTSVSHYRVFFQYLLRDKKDRYANLNVQYDNLSFLSNNPNILKVLSNSVICFYLNYITKD